VLETMSGVRTPVQDALAPYWDVLPDQELKPWQKDAVDRAAQSAGLVM
jgi:hypothetical protein